MWKRVIDRVVVPILFASIATLPAIKLVDRIENYSTLIEEEQVEPTEVDETTPPPVIVISKYDQTFKDVAQQYNLDWRLLAAIARSESMFKPNAVSPAGATGLMQVMPIVAENYGYTRAQLRDVKINVMLAARALNENEKMLRMPEWLNEDEKLKFVLACYNAGYGRIADARALARHYESNAYKWDDVASYLSKLSKSEYARHKVVRHGRFSGSKETIAYVDKVMHTYAQYKAGKTDIK